MIAASRWIGGLALALAETRVSLGNINFSLLALIRGAIAGSLLFWLGQWSNSQSAAYIEKQPMRPAIRQLSIKASEFAIFGVAFLLLMNIMGINLSALAVLGGAIGVGLGFGLQRVFPAINLTRAIFALMVCSSNVFCPLLNCADD